MGDSKATRPRRASNKQLRTLCQSAALLPADTPPQSPIDIGIAKAKAKYLKRKPKFRIRASHLPSAQCVTSERVTSRRHTATQASVTRESKFWRTSTSTTRE